jgi:hypothetical protein
MYRKLACAAIVLVAVGCDKQEETDRRMYWSKFNQSTALIKKQTELIERAMAYRNAQVQSLVAKADAGDVSSGIPQPSPEIEREKAEADRQLHDIQSWISDYEAKYPRKDFPKMYEGG